MFSTDPTIAALLNLAEEAIFSITDTGRLKIFNNAFAGLFQRSESELESSQFQDLLDKAGRAAFTGFLQQVLESNQPQTKHFTGLMGGSHRAKLALTLHPSGDDSDLLGKIVLAIPEEKADESISSSFEELSEKYKTIYNLTFEGIIIHKRGIVIEVNPAFEKMSGFCREELIGENIVHLCVLPAYHPIVFETMEKDHVEAYEIQTRHKDGSIRYNEVESRRINSSDKDLRITAIRDISLRKKAQQQLQESEERYKLLSRVTFEGIFIHDKGIILDANQSLSDMLGYAIEEMVGKNIIPMVVLPQYHQRVIDALTSESTVPYEVEVKHKDGHTFFVEVEAGMVNYHGRWVRVTAARDITVRKQAERKLRESEEELNTFFGRSGDGFFIMNTRQPFYWKEVKNSQKSMIDLMQQMRIIKVNDAMARQCDTTVASLQDKSFLDIYFWDEARAIDLMRELLEKGSVEFEMQEFHTYESPKWIEGHYVVLYNDAGQVRGCCGVRREITERKNAEKSMKHQNAELKKANAELDNFVYMVSHDLKAPIASTKGLISIARLEKEADKVAYCLELIDKSMNKLDSFILDILDYSRNSRVPVKPSKIDFDKLIDEVSTNTQFLQQEHQVIIERDISGTADFYSDRQRLLFIFNNLISNAIRFSDPEKSFSFLKISIHTDGQTAKLIFADNGIGIPKEHRKRIFDMFYRANENRVGSGLGLYIVKEALEKLGGSVAVHSEVGVGTSFEMVIPGLAAV